MNAQLIAMPQTSLRRAFGTGLIALTLAVAAVAPRSVLAQPRDLSEEEVGQLVEFVQVGLLDPDARPERLRHLIPARLPSGRPGFEFQFR